MVSDAVVSLVAPHAPLAPRGYGTGWGHWKHVIVTKYLLNRMHLHKLNYKDKRGGGAGYSRRRLSRRACSSASASVAPPPPEPPATATAGARAATEGRYCTRRTRPTRCGATTHRARTASRWPAAGPTAGRSAAAPARRRSATPPRRCNTPRPITLFLRNGCAL